MSKKVLICDAIAHEAVERMRASGLMVDEKIGMSPEQLTACIGEYDAVVVRSATKIREAQIAAAKRLRVIVRGGVGVDNIDVAAAQREGIGVLNTPAAASVSVAELALGMILTLARQIAWADAAMKDSRWDKKAFAKGMELEGKTLGILGVGRIGRALARKASGVGLVCVGADTALPSSGHFEGLTLLTAEELYERADVLSLHVPRPAGGAPLIGAAEISRMKPGVLIVNCARGGVVDEKSLLEALDSGRVGGAALDVFESEPPADWTLARHPRVVATPHLGASTKEAQARVGMEVAELLLEHL